MKEAKEGPSPKIIGDSGVRNLIVLQTIKTIFTIFSKKERATFIASFFVCLIASILLLIWIIKEDTVLSPVAGGEYVEGVIGQPIFVNPIYAQNNQTDNDLSRLLYADIASMAETITIGNDKRTYDIRLKGDITWQDRQPITTDDILFTVKLIQDPDANSPLAPLWKGIQAERISEREIRMTAPATYSFFETDLRSLQPIPKHLFGNIPSANIRLSDYNLEPIGSGPYQFVAFQKRRDGFITQYTMKASDRYFGAKPYITTITLKFYQDSPSELAAFNNGDIDGMAVADPNIVKKISIPHQTRQIEMPRYYAVFFNPYANPNLNEKAVREALDFATDKMTIIDRIFGRNALAITGPMPPFTKDTQGAPSFDIAKANMLLDEAGWYRNDSGIRQKNGHDLSFILTVYQTPFLIDTAQLLKEQWKAAGIDLHINIAQSSDFTSAVIRQRDYEMLLFGNIYGKNLDPYSFWHSSQKLAPGLNLSLYDNNNADALIDGLRRDFNPDSRAVGMRQLQPIIIADKPAIFLYSPYYLYVSNRSLKGFDATALPTPSDRFTHINTWYLKTVRTLKK